MVFTPFLEAWGFSFYQQEYFLKIFDIFLVFQYNQHWPWLGDHGWLSDVATPTISSFFYTIIMVINHKKFHQENISSKVINRFVFHHAFQYKAKIGNLILALRYAYMKHKLVNNFGTNRDILMKIFEIDHHDYVVK